MRMTEAEFKNFMKKSPCSVNHFGEGARKKPRVNSRKAQIDGHLFDSQAEAQIYWELKVDPNVEILELQPKFELLKPFFRIVDKKTRKFSGIFFTPDFKVLEMGRELIIEVKSIGTIKANSKSYSMRRKMFLSAYPGILFREIIFDGKKRIIREY
jgi:hypothetical protein